mmetsp:Transcript_6895/g.10561  ORF Transcript_6895/g.10561 Transcript_6895/m.10561 type:complete len:531 (+) Transcript_6895:2-1594(+)
MTLRLVIISFLVALLPPIDKNNSANGPLLFVYANVPPTSSRGSRFTRKRNRKTSSDNDDGLTLGDLEVMQQQQSNNNGGGTFIPTAAIFGQQREQQQQQTIEAEDESSEQSTQLRRSLRRINLDLSGRVMCHVVSPKIQNDAGDDRAAVKMNSMPLFQLPSRFDSNNNKKLRRIQRHIPHIYIGANYDLDEIWYGATRWIAKCSWCLPQQSIVNDSTRAKQLVESIFPTSATKRSAWMLDLEREQSVFEHGDSTMRVSLLQQSDPTTVQKLSVEYDSAKYSNHRAVNKPTSSLILSPTISVNLHTPILHPRIELRTKKTWIVQHGGDIRGNYYGGASYGSVSPVERRLESIRDGYRALIPRSQFKMGSDSSSSSTTTTTMERLQNVGKKLSNWLEEDGWMPKRVTTDLMGNFISVNEVGFSSEPMNEDSSKERKSTTRPLLPSRDNMGIRLRISKRIDWTSLGIFPWSNNQNNSYNQSNNAPTPTCVRFDLCGLHNSGNSMSQIGCEFDPLCLGETFKVVIGHDGVDTID